MLPCLSFSDYLLPYLVAYVPPYNKYPQSVDNSPSHLWQFVLPNRLRAGMRIPNTFSIPGCSDSVNFLFPFSASCSKFFFYGQSIDTIFVHFVFCKIGLDFQSHDIIVHIISVAYMEISFCNFFHSQMLVEL